MIPSKPRGSSTPSSGLFFLAEGGSHTSDRDGHNLGTVGPDRGSRLRARLDPRPCPQNYAEDRDGWAPARQPASERMCCDRLTRQLSGGHRRLLRTCRRRISAGTAKGRRRRSPRNLAASRAPSFVSSSAGPPTVRAVTATVAAPTVTHREMPWPCRHVKRVQSAIRRCQPANTVAFTWRRDGRSLVQ